MQLPLRFTVRRFEIGPSYESWGDGRRAYIGAHSCDLDWPWYGCWWA